MEPQPHGENTFEDAVELVDRMTPYQLYRLSARISLLMEDPARLKPVARALTPGCEIEYFCASENRSIPAIVNKINRTTASVTNVGDGEVWRIDLASVDTGGAAIDSHASHSDRPLARQDLSVGQLVGFVGRDHENVYGVIVRLNQKTVTLECDFGKKWRVSYSLLFEVLDGATAHGQSSEDRPHQQLLIES